MSREAGRGSQVEQVSRPPASHVTGGKSSVGLTSAATLNGGTSSCQARRQTPLIEFWPRGLVIMSQGFLFLGLCFVLQETEPPASPSAQSLWWERPAQTPECSSVYFSGSRARAPLSRSTECPDSSGHGCFFPKQKGTESSVELVVSHL